MPTDDHNLRAHFRAPNWFRWYMADQFLEHYDWLILVDPDQFVTPECWGPERFSFVEDVLLKTNKHVVMRDIFPPQTLNNGVVALRNSPQGRAFLDLLLEKISWVQTFQHDQGAFDETVLEIVGLIERAARGQPPELYDSFCLPWLFPEVSGAHQIAAYSLCWWHTLKTYTGGSGNRSALSSSFWTRAPSISTTWWASGR